MNAGKGERLPPLAERPSEPIDRIWWGALPVWYLIMVGYGITAAVFPIQAVAAVGGFDRAAIFGAAIALVGIAMLLGTVRSIMRQKPQFEMWATIVFLALMGVYLAALYIAVQQQEDHSRPGSTFLPLLFSVFPFTRVLAIIRGGRVRWLREAAIRWRKKRA